MPDPDKVCHHCPAARSARVTHIYDLHDYADDPRFFCDHHAIAGARKLGGREARIVGIGRPGATPPTGPTKAPAPGRGVHRG